MPFIEMNGEEIADSNIIIDTLSKKFEKVNTTDYYVAAQVCSLNNVSGDASSVDSGPEECSARYDRHG